MPVILGVLVHSSNIELEPAVKPSYLCTRSRRHGGTFLSVSGTKISLDGRRSLSPTLMAPIMAAARLLADAEVDLMGRSGTSGGWLGFHVDEKPCKCIAENSTWR